VIWIRSPDPKYGSHCVDKYWGWIALLPRHEPANRSLRYILSEHTPVGSFVLYEAFPSPVRLMTENGDQSQISTYLYYKKKCFSLRRTLGIVDKNIA
jgi:hypothetical protein